MIIRFFHAMLSRVYITKGKRNLGEIFLLFDTDIPQNLQQTQVFVVVI